MEKNIQKNYEVNFIDLFQIIWQGKWKIFVVTVIFVLTAYIYQANQVKKFTSTTPILPITTFEMNKYTLINNQITKVNLEENFFLDSTNQLLTPDSGASNVAQNFNNQNINKKKNIITKKKLLNLYIEVINEKKLFKNAIHKFNLIDPNQYSNEFDYDVAVTKLATTIKIFKPILNKKKDYDYYSTIEFSYHDPEKWKETLIYVTESANLIIRQTLQEEFQKYLMSTREQRENKIEDLEIKISNAITDYYREISDRIEYLKEQAAIAKKLGIAKNTIEVQTFGNQNAILSNVKTDSPFYLRGYEAINKEIELINLRTDNKAFISGLRELEQKKRSIIQDKSLERIEAVLFSSPIYSNIDFQAAKTDILATKFQYESSRKILLIALIFGLMIGTFYILIDNVIRFQKISNKK